MVYLLVVGNYACKFVCQFVGWGLCLLLGLSVCWLGGYVWYRVCLFVGWGVMFGIEFVCLLVGGHVITYLLTLGMVSVLDFFITDLKQAHGF